MLVGFILECLGWIVFSLFGYNLWCYVGLGGLFFGREVFVLCSWGWVGRLVVGLVEWFVIIFGGWLWFCCWEWVGILVWSRYVVYVGWVFGLC